MTAEFGPNVFFLIYESRTLTIDTHNAAQCGQAPQYSIFVAIPSHSADAPTSALLILDILIMSSNLLKNIWRYQH